VDNFVAIFWLSGIFRAGKYVGMHISWHIQILAMDLEDAIRRQDCNVGIRGADWRYKVKLPNGVGLHGRQKRRKKKKNRVLRTTLPLFRGSPTFFLSFQYSRFRPFAPLQRACFIGLLIFSPPSDEHIMADRKSREPGTSDMNSWLCPSVPSVVQEKKKHKLRVSFRR
jgi:hypothetical protein